jgi:hypothetical protein
MKKIITLLAVIGMFGFQGCEGPEGPKGTPGQDGLIAEVFELKKVNFSHDNNSPNTTGYTIYQKLNPVLYNGDVVLIYRLIDTTLSGAPVWQQIPRTLFLAQGELDYDFDFSKEDFTIYAGGNYNLTLTPKYLNGQTFRIVIVPGPANVTGKSASKKVDLSDYNAVIKVYNIDDSNVKQLN